MKTPGRVGPKVAKKRSNSFLGKMFHAAHDMNCDVIRSAASKAAERTAVARDTDLHNVHVVDVGCGDGRTTGKIAPDGVRLTGLEYSSDAVSAARCRGVDAREADLSKMWPIDAMTVDVALSNQVIEHLADVDHFAAETFRVLRPGGTAIISTENIASWHNIAALTAGWQPFSSANFSKRAASLGNPFGGLVGAEPLPEGWQHLVLFSATGLAALLRTHGFTDVRVKGAGYYPLPASLAKLDARHAAFITAVARKPATLHD